MTNLTKDTGEERPTSASRAMIAEVMANLKSESGENPEYDRALIEVYSDLFGYTQDEKPVVAKLLGIKGYENKLSGLLAAVELALVEGRDRDPREIQSYLIDHEQAVWNRAIGPALDQIEAMLDLEP